MPFLDVPSSPSELPTASGSSALPHLKLKQNEQDPPRIGAKLQEVALTPVAGFVIKTTLQTLHAATSAPPLTKLFINVSSAEQVPPPSDEKANPLCAVGAAESTTDKAGNRSLVIDATLSVENLSKTKRDKKYKQWLIQWALEKVEEKLGVDLSRNYTEPNIKSKGALLPRKAVLPIPVVTPAATNKIQLVEEEDRLQRGSVTQSTSTPKSASIQPDQSKALVKPKTEFEIVDEGAAFVFTIMLPEEPAFDSVAKSASFTLTKSHIAFASPRYKLDTDLPVNVDVQDVSTRGAEWSEKDKAVRIWGRLEL